MTSVVVTVAAPPVPEFFAASIIDALAVYSGFTKKLVYINPAAANTINITKINIFLLQNKLSISFKSISSSILI